MRPHRTAIRPRATPACLRAAARSRPDPDPHKQKDQGHREVPLVFLRAAPAWLALLVHALRQCELAAAAADGRDVERLELVALVGRRFVAGLTALELGLIGAG